MDYTITEINFSERTDVSGGTESSHQYTKTHTLVAHVMFEYLNFMNEKELGTCVADVATIATVTSDENGYLTQISEGSIPTYSDILDVVTPVVEAYIKQIVIQDVEKSVVNKYLNEVRSLAELPDLRYSKTGQQVIDEAAYGI